WADARETDRMGKSFVAKNDLDSEMTVVRNEFESGENSPMNVLEERILSTAYLWHNYGKSTIGARSDRRFPVVVPQIRRGQDALFENIHRRVLSRFELVSHDSHFAVEVVLRDEGLTHAVRFACVRP